MRVCDVCQTRPADGHIEAPIKLIKHEHTLDFCKECVDYVSVNSLFVGIKEVMKHKEGG